MSRLNNQDTLADSLILASSSPRRRELLRQIGVAIRVVPPEIDEQSLEGEPPESLVVRLSVEKAAVVADQFRESLVLGSDTIVLLDNQVLGKPENEGDARNTLKRLSGKTHTVLTGYALLRRADGTSITGVGRASVTFRTLASDEIDAYVATGSPMDKAGAYGIQEDLGAVFIQRIDGDYYSIVGLPLQQVYTSLRDLNHPSLIQSR